MRLAFSLSVCAAAGSVSPGHAQTDSIEYQGRAPQIEVRAPRAFGRTGHPTTHEYRVRYQINATVLLPLLSIPIAHRDDVGFASAAVQEFESAGAQQVTALELFSASFPERARGLNRTGFIREAVSRSQDAIGWTAHFGALSSNPETSRQEVALDGDETLQSYTVMDGFTSRSQSSNIDAHLVLDGSWSSAPHFYETLMPIWRATKPENRTQSHPHAEVPYMEPLGFLGILQHSLGIAAGDVDRRSVPRMIRHPFAHKGELMFLVLADHRVDTGRQRRYVSEGLVTAEATVHRLDYRLLNGDNDQVQRFRLWTELPAASGRLRDPFFPIEFEFKAKSFLELQAVRVEPDRARIAAPTGSESLH